MVPVVAVGGQRTAAARKALFRLARFQSENRRSNRTAYSQACFWSGTSTTSHGLPARKPRRSARLVSKEWGCKVSSNWEQDPGMRLLGGHTKALDRAMTDLMGSEPALECKAPILQSIPGVSSVATAGLLPTLPEPAELQPEALRILAGLASVTRRSETWQDHSSIQGGRLRVRLLPLMSALTASCRNSQLAAFYECPTSC